MKQDRLSAHKVNDTYYNTSKPCKHGHAPLRYTKSGICVECGRSYSQRWAKHNKTRRSITNRNLHQKNPKTHARLEAKRRADKLNRTPPWADLKKIDQIYADCPEEMTVDHIIPLRGKLVSGLHVHNNLQYLTPKENCSKSNRFEV